MFEPPAEWTLLIYIVPARPSRKRAWIWRELRKVGALYLRDGVAVLPQSPAAAVAFGLIAKQVQVFEGTAVVAERAALAPEVSARLRMQLAEARADEYAEITQETRSFLAYLRQEAGRRPFSTRELRGFERDLEKLRTWVAQVEARDWLTASAPLQLRELLQLIAGELVGLRQAAGKFR